MNRGENEAPAMFSFIRGVREMEAPNLRLLLIYEDELFDIDEGL